MVPFGGEALNTKRLPLPRLETYASRDIALQNLGDSVHFWPSRRKGSGRNTGEGVDDPNGGFAQPCNLAPSKP